MKSPPAKIVSNERTVRYRLPKLQPTRRPARGSPLKGKRVESRSPERRKAWAATLSRDATLRRTADQVWWGFLRSGLVRDPTAKHKKAMRQAVWLYLYFLVVANWRNGTLFRKMSTIATETGFHPRTVQRWLRTLRRAGYIVTRSNGRSLLISLTKWRPISKRAFVKTDDTGEPSTATPNPIDPP